MNSIELQQLRDLPIEEVAERLGMRVSRHKALCPFHDDHTPSLSFNQQRNTFRCFVCGAHGGTIDLVMKKENKSFREACEWLKTRPTPIKGVTFSHSTPIREGDAIRTASLDSQLSSLDSQLSSLNSTGFDASRYERFFLRPFLSDSAKAFLYDERKLDPRVVKWCRLTSWRDRQGVEWLQIPYYDTEYNLVGIQNRRLSPPTPEGGVRPTPIKGVTFSHSTPVREGGAMQDEVIVSQSSSIPDGTPSLTGRAGVGLLPRFRFPRGSCCSIYNLPVTALLKPREALYITEGCSDCWAMLSSGHKAIAIPSATLLSRRDKEFLTDLSARLSTEFHMYPDRDVPGERLFLQLKEVLPNIVHHQLPPGCKDYGELWAAPRNNGNTEIRNYGNAIRMVH